MSIEAHYYKNRSQISSDFSEELPVGSEKIVFVLDKPEFIKGPDGGIIRNPHLNLRRMTVLAEDEVSLSDIGGPDGEGEKFKGLEINKANLWELPSLFEHYEHVVYVQPRDSSALEE